MKWNVCDVFSKERVKQQPKGQKNFIQNSQSIHRKGKSPINHVLTWSRDHINKKWNWSEKTKMDMWRGQAMLAQGDCRFSRHFNDNKRECQSTARWGTFPSFRTTLTTHKCIQACGPGTKDQPTWASGRQIGFLILF